MGVLLFRLRHVPDDEADDIRALLSDNDIDFYETSVGSWGISLPAIWLHDEAQLEKARALIDAYQQQRQKSARETYEQQRRKGKHRTIPDKVKEAPVQSIIYLAAVLIILYLTIMPFMRIFR
ncbi:MAG: DUF6164 family protein [Mariprofundaceae bacterium]|nr:DUF6164 family protein [Mariprofundaceae bacterium]